MHEHNKFFNSSKYHITQNYKILKKSSECLLCYSAFLIDNKEIDKAIEVLFLVLRNETNIAIILSYRLKNKQKS